MNILKISSKSNPSAVAGAIISVIKENGKVELQTVGAGALNQAIKATAIARGYAAPMGMDLVCIPSFVLLDIAEEQRTGIKIIVKGV